jgi:hypothetical protein
MRKDLGLPVQDMIMSTNRARDTVGIAHTAAAMSEAVLSVSCCQAERLTKNQRALYLVRTAVIAAKVVNAAKGTMLLRRTITALMLRIGSS